MWKMMFEGALARESRKLLPFVAVAVLALVAGPALAGDPFVHSKFGFRTPTPPEPSWMSKFVSPADKVSLNPQPLPPKVYDSARISRPGDWVMLNPQPLPPKIWKSGLAYRGIVAR